MTIAAGDGIGGGTLLVPMLAILSSFCMLEVVALSNVTILAGTVTNVLFNLPRKSPSGIGPVIDHDLLLLFGPTIVMGSIAGSHLNYFIPGWITKLLVMLLMLPMAWRTISKACRTWASESRTRFQQPDKATDDASEPVIAGTGDTPPDPSCHRPCSAAAAAEAALLHGDRKGAAEPAFAGADRLQEASLMSPGGAAAGGDGGGGGGGYDLWRRPSSVNLASSSVSGQLPLGAVSKCHLLDHDGCVHTYELDCKMESAMEHHAAAQYPKRHLLVLAGTMLVIVLCSLCAHFLVTCSTWQYWLVTLSPIPVMCLIWAAMRWHVLWCLGWRDYLGMAHNAEVKWTPRTTVVYPATCTLIGMLAGLLGLGGGTFMTPMLLELGVHPSVAAASSQAATQIGTFAASVVYLVNCSVPADYGIAMVLMGLGGAMHGQLVINYLIGRTNRPSIVVLMLAVLFIAAVGTSAAVAGMAIADVVEHPYKLTLTNAANLCGGNKL